MDRGSTRLYLKIGRSVPILVARAVVLTNAKRENDLLIVKSLQWRINRSLTSSFKDVYGCRWAVWRDHEGNDPWENTIPFDEWVDERFCPANS